MSLHQPQLCCKLVASSWNITVWSSLYQCPGLCDKVLPYNYRLWRISWSNNPKKKSKCKIIPSFRGCVSYQSLRRPKRWLLHMTRDLLLIKASCEAVVTRECCSDLQELYRSNGHQPSQQQDTSLDMRLWETCILLNYLTHASKALTQKNTSLLLFWWWRVCDNSPQNTIIWSHWYDNPTFLSRNYLKQHCTTAAIGGEINQRNRMLTAKKKTTQKTATVAAATCEKWQKLVAGHVVKDVI